MIKKKQKLGLNVVLIFLVIFLVSCGKQETDWAGTIKEVDGVVVVKNPLEPIYGEEAFSLEEELVIGEAERSEEYMFQSIYMLDVSDIGDIYDLDFKAQHVKVFNQNGKYLRTIGRPGQGPGELFFPRSVDYTSYDEVVVGTANNITYFSPEGEYLKSLPLTNAPRGTSIKIDSDGNIFGLSSFRDLGVYELRKYDPEFSQLYSYDSSPHPPEELQRTGKMDPFFNALKWDIINGNQIVCGYPGEGYILKIYDSSANLIRKIEKKYIQREITEKDLEEEKTKLPPDLRENVTAPKYFPPYRDLKADDEGRTYVYTYERVPDSDKYYYDIFDPEGRYILKVPLMTRFWILKNKLYSIEEDEEGYQYIKRYRIIWGF